MSSILTHGLIPRKYLDETNIDYISVNSKEMDSYTDANCLNVSFPHYDLVFDATKKTQKNWVCISYIKDVLWRLNCAFYSTSQGIHISPVDERRSFQAFDEIFMENDHLPMDYPTDSKAEVLIFDVIPPFFFKTVTFYDDVERDNWVKNNPLFSFNDRLFSRRDKIKSGCESAKEVNIHH